MIYLLIVLHVISADAIGFQASFGLDFRWLAALSSSNEEYEIKDVCWTKECFQVALNILYSINASVSPCDNFYEFACGNWNLHNPVLRYEPWMTRDAKLSKLAHDRLRDELESESPQEEILPVKQIKALYRSCMTMTQSQIIHSINAILQKAKGWPMIMEPGTWNSSAITWQELDRYYQELMGLNAFYDLSVADHPSKYSILKIAMKKTLLKKPSRVRKIAIMLMEHNKVEVDKKRLSRELNELEAFADELSTVPEPPIDKFFKNYGAFIRWWDDNGGATDTLNNLDWRLILGRLSLIKHPRMMKHTPIGLLDVDYFQQLPDILESTDKRIIVNFIHFQFVLRISLMIHDRSIAADDLTGNPRWMNCLNAEEPAAAHLFVRKYYGSHDKAAAEEIVRNIRKSFELQITASNWLPDRLKTAAKEVVRRLKYILGNEDWYMNQTALIDYYKGLTIGENYLDNILRLKKREWDGDMKLWGEPLKSRKWQHSVVDEGGENAVQFDYIYIPAADLQSPLLHQDVPHYFGYGLVGFGIGHEIGHDFDNGRSSFFKSEIIDARDRSIFTKSAQCYIDLFDGYVNGSGKRTLSENLADWYGMQAAVVAYKEVKQKIHPNEELKLPGLHMYTDLQMFFLSYAQSWCGGDYSWDNGEHHANAYRVIGTLSNTRAFADAFECPKTSPMNPEKKCDIWRKKPDKSR